jgi:putative PIN family toxin of toxin-antitoxin system
MRVVLDTNVLVSAVISTGVPHDVVVAGYEGEYQLIVSEATAAEFRETLRKYPNRFGLTDDETRTEVEPLQYFAEFVDPDEEVNAVEDDPDDDKFLEAAVAGDAGSPVSGDEHLLALD